MSPRAVLAAAILVCAACGGESAPASSAASPAATAPAAAAAAFSPDCLDRVRARVPAEGRRRFPDDPDVTWIVHGVTRDGDSARVVAEAEPQPATVGYPRFLFVSECRGAADPALLGAYARENDAWTLLFTTDGAPPLPPTRP